MACPTGEVANIVGEFDLRIARVGVWLRFWGHGLRSLSSWLGAEVDGRFFWALHRGAEPGQLSDSWHLKKGGPLTCQKKLVRQVSCQNHKHHNHQHGRLHPAVAQRLIPMGLFVQIIVETPQLLEAVADVPVVRYYRFSRAGCFNFGCCVTFCNDGHWAALGSCSATWAATTALVVATRAGVDRCGLGSCDAPQRAAERRPTGTEDRHQGQGGG